MKSIHKLAKRSLYLSSCISIIDNDTVIIENCKQITESCDVVVKIVTADNILEIWGQGLSATSYSNTTIEIKGQISYVNIEQRRSSI